MPLTKNLNKTLLYTLILFSFVAFISPLSPVLFIFPCLIMLVSPILLNDNDLLCVWAFSACFMSCFRFQALFLTMLDISMLLFVIKTLCANIKNKQKSTFIYVMFAFFVICFIYSCFVSKNAYKISQSLGIVLTIIVLFIIKNFSLKSTTLYLSLGLVCSSLLSLVGHFSGFSHMQPYFFDGSSLRFGGYFCNVNALALYCSLCQACLLSLFLTKNLAIQKWGWLLLLITAIGLTSFSKTFILISVCTYGLAVLLGFINSKNKKTYIKYSLILLAVAILLMLIGHNYIALMLKRFSNNSYSGALNSLTTGRLEIWKGYLRKWSSSTLYILFGCGITAPNINDRTTHNFIVSLLYKFGIVGIIALIIAIIYILKNAKLNKNVSCYIPLIVILINGLSEDLACSLYTCLPILIAFLPIFNNRKINKDN